MLHYLRDKHNTVRAGREISDLAVSIRKIVEKLTLELDRNPTDLEIAKGLEISLDRWLKIRQGLYECDNISFNVKVGTLGDERSELIDLTADRPQYYRTQLDEILTDIDGSIEQLYGNERRSIECYYLDNMSRKDTAKQIGVSPMTVTRYLVRGVRKLKALLDV
jgi:RNA polymerase sigma-B factor